MFHHMNLEESPFDFIKKNLKTVELRLNDEKRQLIKEDDKIIFTNIKTGETIIKKVFKKYVFKSFKELYDYFPKTLIGYQSDQISDYKDMLLYYSEDLIKRYGVLGIELIDIDPIFNLETESLKSDEITLKLTRTSGYHKEKNYIPAYYFDIYLTEVNQKIGNCDLRIGHNRNTYYGGNIGYGIEEAYRGHRYAKKACLLLKDFARLHKMPYLIITCNKDNIASKKTIESLNATLLEKTMAPKDTELYPTELLIYKIKVSA